MVEGERQVRGIYLTVWAAAGKLNMEDDDLQGVELIGAHILVLEGVVVLSDVKRYFEIGL